MATRRNEGECFCLTTVSCGPVSSLWGLLLSRVWRSFSIDEVGCTSRGSAYSIYGSLKVHFFIGSLCR